ncbi:MAG: hypothetical protein WCT08_00195 [Patescibacteria group bacterium]|jgi:hypothetical protein
MRWYAVTIGRIRNGVVVRKSVRGIHVETEKRNPKSARELAKEQMRRGERILKVNEVGGESGG